MQHVKFEHVIMSKCLFKFPPEDWLPKAWNTFGKKTYQRCLMCNTTPSKTSSSTLTRPMSGECFAESTGMRVQFDCADFHSSFRPLSEMFMSQLWRISPGPTITARSGITLSVTW